MSAVESNKPKLALVIGNVPTVDEVDQFRLLSNTFEVSVVSSQSICEYLAGTSFFHNLRCVALPDHDDNPSYLPGLERVISEYSVVIVKERLGLYAFQAVKAKWRANFKLVVWCDNLSPFPGDDIPEMRTIRSEVTRAADLFLVQTKAARNALVLEGVNDERIADVVPFVAQRIKRGAKIKAEARKMLGLGTSDVVIAAFGQVEWEEGVVELIHSIKHLALLQPNLAKRVKVVVCGIGSYAQDLKTRVQQLGLEDNAIYVAPGRDAFNALTAACDAVFYGARAHRDRIDGDPYRLLSAMAHEVPVLAVRSPLVEELCGKHRIDFCDSSIESLADAIEKLTSETSLVNNVVAKNLQTVKQRFNEKRATESMLAIMTTLSEHSAGGNVGDAFDSSEIDARVGSVEALVSGRNYIGAVDLIEQILKTEALPVHHIANLHRLIGDSFAKLGDLEGAKHAYIRTLEFDEYSSRAYIGLGTIAILRSTYDLAVPQFQRAVSLAPNDEMANLGLGMAFQGLGESKEAAHWILTALQMNPLNTVAIYNLVKVSYELDNYIDAEMALRKYLEAVPSDANMKYALAGILLHRGAFAEAEALAMDVGADTSEDAPRTATLLQQIRQAKAASQDSAQTGSRQG